MPFLRQDGCTAKLAICISSPTTQIQIYPKTARGRPPAWPVLSLVPRYLRRSEAEIKWGIKIRD
jgi:hypothetical protein